VSDNESIVDRLVGAVGDGEDPRAAQFVRGLALGALVGAAIAGSTIWQRRRSSGRTTLQIGATAADTGSANAAASGASAPPSATPSGGATVGDDAGR
jgi:hypothetical protein